MNKINYKKTAIGNPKLSCLFVIAMFLSLFVSNEVFGAQKASVTDNPFNLLIPTYVAEFTNESTEVIQEYKERHYASYVEMLKGTGNILVCPDYFQDIIAYRSIRKQPLSDDILRVHFDLETNQFASRVLRDVSIYDNIPPLSTVIIFPKTLEVGKTYHIHYLIGPLFNPEDGLLKPLVIYNETLEDQDEYRIYSEMDPGISLNHLQVKLAIPEDKVYVHYEGIQIRELWNDQMETPYISINSVFRQMYDEYILNCQEKIEPMDKIAYYNQNANVLFFNWLPKTIEFLEENMLFGSRARTYMDQTRLAESIDQLSVLFVDISLLGANRMVKAIKLLKNRKIAESVIDTIELARTSVEAVTTLSQSWKQFLGEYADNPTLFSDFQIMAYNENDYDIVSIEWVDDVPFLIEAFSELKKNNILISIPVTIERELEVNEIVGNYITVNYDYAWNKEQRMSQYFPWQKGSTPYLINDILEAERPQTPYSLIFQTDPEELGERKKMSVSPGETVRLEAESFAGYEFASWLIDWGIYCNFEDNRQLELEMEKDATVTAVYEKALPIQEPEKPRHSVTGVLLTPLWSVYSLASKETVFRLEGESTVLEYRAGNNMGAMPINFYFYDVPEGRYTLNLYWGGDIVATKVLDVYRDITVIP